MAGKISITKPRRGTPAGEQALADLRDPMQVPGIVIGKIDDAEHLGAPERTA